MTVKKEVTNISPDMEEYYRKEERLRIERDLEKWNESGYMSDCLGCFWNELIQIVTNEFKYKPDEG